MKLRVIDDAKQSGFNAAFQRTCEASLMDLDALTSVMATIAKAMVDGEYQGVPLHPDVKTGQWLGRTLDLTRAYKQLAISPESRRVEFSPPGRGLPCSRSCGSPGPCTSYWPST